MNKTSIKKFNVMEYNSWILGRKSPHNCVVVIGVDGDIDLNKLQLAVNIISEENEYLRYSVSPDVCGFISTNKDIKINLRVSSESWQSLCEEELKKNFSEGDVLLRITVLKSDRTQYIIFCGHHIISDGSSGMEFLLHIIDIYNGNKHSDSWKNHKINEINFYPEIREPDFIKPDNNVVTKIQSIQIGEGGVRALIDFCQEYGISVNAYLSAQILISMNEIFGVEKTNLSYSANLRKAKEFTPENKLKFLTSWIDLQPENIGEKDLIELSEMIQEQIKNKFREKQHISNLESFCNFVNERTNDEDYLRSFISKTSSICVSNGGNLEDKYEKNNPELRLKEFHLSVNAQSFMGTPDSFTILITMLNNRALFIDVNYPDPVVDGNKVNLFLKTLLHKVTHEEHAYSL